jgi:hypothetical protein
MLYLLIKNIMALILMVSHSTKKKETYVLNQLLGRPMDIRLVGGVDDGSQQPIKRGSYANGIGGGNQRSGFRNNNQQNGTRGGANRSRGGKQQQNGTGGKGKKEDVTADDLDAELDAYRAESTPKK